MEINLTEIQKLKMSIVANLNFDVEKAKQEFMPPFPAGTSRFGV